MRTQNFLLAGAALALLRRAVAMPVIAEGATHSAPESISDYANIDAYVEREMRRLKLPGVALAVVAGDRIVHMRGFGKAHPDGTPPTPQTPFYIGSVTKPFTALAAMQLVEAGKLELDAPVQRYLPWFRLADPVASGQITVRHLLNQTGGLPSLPGELILADSDDQPDAAERQARTLATREPRSTPGASFDYNNANFQLLGLIIERVSGQTYADYLRRHILDPLDMRHTFTSHAAAEADGLATGHRLWFGLPVAAPDLPEPGGALAAGLLISCAEDLAHFAVAMLSAGRYGEAQLVSPAGLAELHRPAAGYNRLGISLDYALGWFVSDLGERQLVWHGGTLPHFGGYVGLLPAEQLGIVLVYNANQHWMLPVLAEFGTRAVAVLAGEPYKPTPLAHSIPWLLRAQLLLPLLQVAGVATTLHLLRRWRREPERRPRGRRAWSMHLLLPLIPNLLLATLLRPLLGERRHYVQLYMPDCAWIARLSGSFALLWSGLRTLFVLRAARVQVPEPARGTGKETRP